MTTKTREIRFPGFCATCKDQRKLAPVMWLPKKIAVYKCGKGHEWLIKW